MELFEKATGHCEIQNKQVEILMMRIKKQKQKGATLTPMRCHSSNACAKSVFCRFVNPLTTRLPVKLGAPSEAEAS